MAFYKAKDYESVCEVQPLVLTKTTVIKGTVIRENNKLSIDLRKYLLKHGGDCPTKNGFRLPVDKIKDLKKLLNTLSSEIENLEKEPCKKEAKKYVQLNLFDESETR